MPSGTRQRILETARLLYNQEGYGNVTLQRIADELGIAKGNLWYHFKEKRTLLTALTEQYVEYLQTRASIWPREGTELQDYVSFLRVVASEVQDYRFMYRDQTAYGEHPETLTKHLDDIYVRVMSQFDAFYRAFKKNGDLDVADEDIEPLVFNATMGLRYSLEFMREIGMETEIGSGAVEHRFRQHLALFQGNISKDALAYLTSELFPDA